MFATKMALVDLPNVHLNAVIIILTTVFFGWKALFSVAIYIMMEGMIFGFGLWWFCYWYLWPLLVVTAYYVRRRDPPVLVWAVIAGLFGLCFGALCTIPFLFLSGLRSAAAMWLAGIPYDVIHCVSNFAMTLILYPPLHKVMCKIFSGSGYPS